jgi:hypothetical protein
LLQIGYRHNGLVSQSGAGLWETGSAPRAMGAVFERGIGTSMDTTPSACFQFQMLPFDL